MSNNHKEKGNALERAVSLIQETILKSDPAFARADLTIEKNVIKIVSGVRHEIDVLVEAHAKTLYKATWLFECKNWSEPVGKNEVIILAAKVNALGATRGFLVARRLTKDAEAQIKLDNRIVALPFTEDFFNEGFSMALSHQEHIPIITLLYMHERNALPVEKPRMFEWKGKSCRWFNQPYDFTKFIHSQVNRIIADDLKENRNKYVVGSSHYCVRRTLVQFDFGEFIIGNYEVEHMTVEVPFWVMNRQLKITSKFELRNQGRVVSFEPFDDEELGEIQISIVQRI